MNLITHCSAELLSKIEGSSEEDSLLNQLKPPIPIAIKQTFKQIPPIHTNRVTQAWTHQDKKLTHQLENGTQEPVLESYDL